MLLVNAVSDVRGIARLKDSQEVGALDSDPWEPCSFAATDVGGIDIVKDDAG